MQNPRVFRPSTLQATDIISVRHDVSSIEFKVILRPQFLRRGFSEILHRGLTPVPEWHVKIQCQSI